MLDSVSHRYRPVEQERITSLLALLPEDCTTVLDAGARDGYISCRIADLGKRVTALDLSPPQVQRERVQCVRGDITKLQFADKSFDIVLCAEVLEHFPPHQLEQACRELQRVARRYLVIGVPYRQDIRVARTTCHNCGGINPPWGHRNSFDEHRLESLFAGNAVDAVSFVGHHRDFTNPVSTYLMDLAGNPYGTYEQDEHCIHCDAPLVAPSPSSVPKKVLTKVAVKVNDMQRLLKRPIPNWIHIRFAASDD